jgi:hypothetical protein
MRKRAYQFCRKMIWKRVAQDYLDLFAEAKEDWAEDSHAAVSVSTAGIGRSDELPEPDLRHIRILTDDTGILRNCLYSTPQRSMGYSVDDQSRGLIVTAMHWQLHHDESVIPLMQTYLGFLAHALDEESGRFRSHMTYERSFSDVLGSEDSHARALWALGMAMALCPHESQIALATRLFRHGLPAVEGFASARAWAYTIVGIHGYLRRFGGDSEIRRYRKMLAERLYEMFVNNRCDDWPWCENVVSYANAKLPHALIMSGKWAQHDEWIDAGKQALSWLLEIQTSEEGMLSIVGSDGWYIRDGKRARFDQQPIEAHALVDACIEAYHVTREQYWLDGARRAFNWFLGDNDLRTPLFDFTTAGCRDGLHPDRVNENQGAESTLAWLMSLLLMQELEMEENLGPLRTDTTNMQRPVTRAIKPSGPVLSRRGKPNASPDRDDQ